MSIPYDPQRKTPPQEEPIDDLMIRDDEAEHEDAGHKTASTVREIASRIPESSSAIGRDISRTIERAMSAKDDYVVAVKVSPEAQEKVDQLVQAGNFCNRGEAAGFFIEERKKNPSTAFYGGEQKNQGN